METDKSYKLLLDFLKSVKNNYCSTKILVIIPNNIETKRIFLSYGCDDYISKPYSYDDLILRSKKLINCLPLKYKVIYESNFLKYVQNSNIVTYQDTYLPLTPRETLVLRFLIENRFANRDEIAKYLNANLNKSYSSTYVSTVIHRVRKKIKLCTGRNLIRNKYGYGYYLI